MVALLFSGQVTALPQYIIMSKLHMINTLWSVIIPAAGTPLGLFLMKNFMTQLPDTMLEAATIDGAGIFTIYYKICMPLVKPAALTLVVFSFQGLWNTTGGSYIYEEVWKLVPTVLNDVAAGRNGPRRGCFRRFRAADDPALRAVYYFGKQDCGDNGLLRN